MAADNNADDNTIQVEVIISVTSDTAVIADGSKHDFAVAVNYGTATVNPTVETFTAVHDQSSINEVSCCLLYTSPSPRDAHRSRMPSSA